MRDILPEEYNLNGVLIELLLIPLVYLQDSLLFILKIIYLPIEFLLKNIFDYEIQFASLFKTKLNRRIQTFTIWMFLMLIPITFLCWYITIILLIFPVTTLPMGYYLYWMNYKVSYFY